MAVLVLVYNGLSAGRGGAKLYFADESRTRLVMERRNIPGTGGLEDRSRAVLDELLLGPMERGHESYLEGSSRVSAILHRDGKLYVDIDIPDLGALLTDASLLAEGMSRSLRESVPGAGTLILHVNGIPYSGPHSVP